jgi:hypothetical protein
VHKKIDRLFDINFNLVFQFYVSSNILCNIIKIYDGVTIHYDTILSHFNIVQQKFQNVNEPEIADNFFFRPRHLKQ